MTRAPGHWIGPERLTDTDDDTTHIRLPDRPCANGCDKPWHPPHSVCTDCIETKRKARQ